MTTFAKLNLKDQKDIVIENAPASFEPEIASLKGVTVRRAPLPDVRFLLFDRAIDALKSWSDAQGGVLSDFRTRQVPSDREPGTILSQKPAALSADYPERGLVMDFIVAGRRGTQLQGFPDIMGLDLTEAARRVTAYARTIPSIRSTSRLMEIFSTQ